MKRFPKSVYGSGGEPDPRFTLANERTFLAWIRTSLALLAAGVALDSFVSEIDPLIKTIATGMLLGTGIYLPLMSLYQWWRTEKALRHQSPLPASSHGILISLVILLAGLAVTLGLFI